MTEVDGKATGWTAHYEGGKWVEEAKKKAAPKKKAAAKKAPAKSKAKAKVKKDDE